MANILFVAFHGLVCLVDGGIKNNVDQGFKAYVLRDSDNVHKQMYGNYLAEKDLLVPSGGNFPVNFKFSNELQQGSATLDANLNPVVKLTDFPPVASNVLAVFTLPRPNQIHNRLRGVVTPGMLVGTQVNRLIQTPAGISAIRFFEYTFNDVTKLSASDDQNVVWNCPPLASVGTDNIAVFHVYDEPPQTLNSPAANAHNVQEFKDSMDFLGADVQITSAAKVDPNSFQQPHPGILHSELAALDVRPDIIKIVHDHRGHAGVSLGGAGGSQVCGGANGLVP